MRYNMLDMLALRVVDAARFARRFAFLRLQKLAAATIMS